MPITKNEENMISYFFDNKDQIISFKKICAEVIATRAINLSILKCLESRMLIKHIHTKGYKITKLGKKYINYKGLAITSLI